MDKIEELLVCGVIGKKKEVRPKITVHGWKILKKKYDLGDIISSHNRFPRVI